MKRKTIFTGAIALLVAGCLLACCGVDVVTESEEESAISIASSVAVSSEETAAEVSSEVPSEETDSEETSSGETSSGETSSEETPEPFEPTPLPEDLPGIDSPDLPESLRYYLPASGHWENTGIDSPPLDYIFTYGKNTMVVEETGHDWYSYWTEYRFDDRGRVVELRGDYRNGETYSNLYTYDEAGRMTGYTSILQIANEYVTTQYDYFYGEDGELIREVRTVTDMLGEMPERTYTTDYLRTYDENGELTLLTERTDSSYIEHLYKDRLERVLRNCHKDGRLFYAFSYDYGENGNRVRKRYRGSTTDSAYAEYFFYEEDKLIEVRREEDGIEQTTYRCAYDAYGRLTVELGNDWGDSYDVYSYDESGSLCKVIGYRPGNDGGYGEMKRMEVTAWGNEAVTEMQLAFYRVAMSRIFYGTNALEEQFYTVKYPEP